ncbi:diaminopimelate decarboxylase [Candidatus Woesearchaeota archaeon]|nr:diaminopimelate decarboxylase [Candidatus Woesearchaeota archaeon]
MTVEKIELARKYGTPLYVYDLDVVRERYRNLKTWVPGAKFFYAMKANYNPRILKCLLDEGASIDAVSVAEVLLALKIGFSADQILFTANMVTDDEMREVKKRNVLFNIGSLSELRRFGQLYPGSEVCLRFNPDIVAGHHRKVRTGGKDTKFGIVLEDLEKAKAVVSEFGLIVVGIHEHTGSGIPETVDMVGGMRNILAIVSPENFPDLRFVDFGGGFKISYYHDEEPPNYSEFGKEVNELFSAVREKYSQLEIFFEPGRYLAAECGCLLVRATTIKENCGKVIVGTDSGFPQLIRPMFYEAHHEITNLSNLGGSSKRYDVAGNICETGDYFVSRREISEISEGDFLCIHDAGAYCYSMGGVYNLRPMPSEVVLDDGVDELVTKRKSNEELVNEIF